ncbi:peptidoglycan-binding protein [Streptomyces sp. NPDC093225]|uniref:peptidoglycan-binding domain-containing protein n=1 Tax=Streptomyces sp. NPDC093225 TaxID=3366034 RepID=UPI003801E3A0
MRKPLVALGTTALLLASSLTLTLGSASDAAADGRAYCKAMFGSYEPLLYQGIQGYTLEVQELQCELNYWRPSLNLAQDGKFGPATRAAVVTFQKFAGLDPDGKVGWYTWTKLDAWCNYLET